jgi:hypothetical protein
MSSAAGGRYRLWDGRGPDRKGRVLVKAEGGAEHRVGQVSMSC